MYNNYNIDPTTSWVKSIEFRRLANFIDNIVYTIDNPTTLANIVTNEAIRQHNEFVQYEIIREQQESVLRNEQEIINQINNQFINPW